MTTIAAIKSGSKIIIAGDNRGQYGSRKMNISDKKVFKNSGFIIGLAGDARAANLLKHGLFLREFQEGEDKNDYIINEFVESVKTCFRENGYSKETSNVEEFDGAMIVVFKDIVFLLSGDFGVTETDDQYWAVGSGQDYALATMKTLLDHAPDMDAEDILLESLKNANYFNAYTGDEFTFITHIIK